jgi:phospholipid/cholesterol/gamma-HCH transport system substrate-binding protein
VCTGCGFHGLYSAPLPGGAKLGDHPYRVTIHFADVLDLVPQSAVKVNDVAVGRVETITLDGWTAKVVVAVNGDVDLPANAYAEIRQTSLLGEKFVSLGPPTGEVPTGRLADVKDPEIPIGRTGSSVEVEEVLGALSLLLNNGDLDAIAGITHELNQALNGRTDAVRSLLTQLNTFVGGVDAQREKITTALTRVNALAQTLADQREILAQTLDSLPGAIKILADERTKLLALLTSLDRLGDQAVRVIDASKSDVISALRSLQPVLEQLTAAGDNIGPTLELMATYPFPRNAVDAVHGDYTNVNATLDLDLSDVLNNLTIVPNPNSADVTDLTSLLPTGSYVPGVRPAGPATGTGG